MMRRRSTINDFLGGGDLSNVVIAHASHCDSGGQCVSPSRMNSPQKRPSILKAGGPGRQELGKAEVDLRRQVRERLRKRRDTLQPRGTGSLVFAMQNKPPGWKDGGDDELDERPNTKTPSKAEQLQTGRRTSTFSTMDGRALLLGCK